MKFFSAGLSEQSRAAQYFFGRRNIFASAFWKKTCCFTNTSTMAERSVERKADKDMSSSTTLLPISSDLGESLKILIIEFKQEMKRDIYALKEDLKKDISEVANTVKGIEKKQAELYAELQKTKKDIITLKETQDKYVKKTDEMELDFLSVKTALLDIKLHMRRNSIRIRGWQEGGQNADLKQELVQWWAGQFPQITIETTDIERAYRAMRKRPPPGKPPRDIIVSFESYAKKTQILKELQYKENLTYQGQPVTVFQELPQEILDARKLFREELKKLRARSIHYKWGYPIHVLIFHRGQTLIANTPDRVKEIYEEIISEAPDFSAASGAPHQQMEEESVAQAAETSATLSQPRVVFSAPQQSQLHLTQDISVIRQSQRIREKREINRWQRQEKISELLKKSKKH